MKTLLKECSDVLTLNITTLLSGGEIDHNTHRRYTYQTASSAFHRVARDHGWLR